MAHGATWICPEHGKDDNNIKSNQIDYILINNNIRSQIKDARTYNGIWTDTDHRLVVTSINIGKNFNQNKYKRHEKRQSNINIERFAEKEIKEKYQERMNKELELLNTNECKNEDKWKKNQ